jgi:FkbM family methyltransferase
MVPAISGEPLRGCRAKGQIVFEKLSYLSNHHGFRLQPITTLTRLGAWRLRCALGRPAVISLPKWDVRMSLPPQWRGVAKIAYTFRSHYEPELSYLERFLSPGDTFVDIGASFGIYTLAAARLVGQIGQVLSFEPGQAAFRVLVENIQLNGLSNVRPLSIALSDSEGGLRLYHYADPSRNSLGSTGDAERPFEEVSVESLDAVLKRMQVKRVKLIKMDVEGAEELVLRGAGQCLNTNKPTVLFEVNQEASKALDLRSTGAWDCLKSIGYSFYRVGRYAGRTSKEKGSLEKITECPVDHNVVAIHDGIVV